MYYVVVPFGRDEQGMVVPGEAKEAPNGDMAIRRAKALLSVGENVGAVAFWRAADPSSGEFSDAVILASIGEVELGALMG